MTSTRTSKRTRYLYIGRDDPLNLLMHGKVYDADIVSQRKRGKITIEYTDGTETRRVSYDDHYKFDDNWVYVPMYD